MSKIRNYIHTPYLAKWNEKYFQLLEFGIRSYIIISLQRKHTTPAHLLNTVFY